MCACICAGCDDLWEVCLTPLIELCKYFFAHDKQKLARLGTSTIVPYRDDCRSIHCSRHTSRVYAGNFTVNNDKISFCTVGLNPALAHMNRSMNASGGEALGPLLRKRGHYSESWCSRSKKREREGERAG